jgi:tRNA(Ile)-lysidine synthase
LAERVLHHIRRQELLHAGERVGIAVSGGIDSVALFRLLLELRSELGIVLSVVHFNHKLRGEESDGDEEFVAKLARDHDLEFYVECDEVSEHAREQGVSLETAARELRYGFFRELMQAGSENSLGEVNTPALSQNPQPGLGTEARLDKIVTGHTLDDQAETVLMRMIRGAGLKGLAGIHPRILVEDDHGNTCGEIIRPLLAFRRRELQVYVGEIGQDWREDATNVDTSFTRNRVRKLIIPILEKEFNPAVAENLAELAEIARGEQDYWENELAGWMGTGVHWSEPEWARTARASASLVQIRAGQETSSQEDLQSRIDHALSRVMNAFVDRMWFLSEPVAVQRRVVKAIGEHAGIMLDFKHVEEVLRFANDAEGTSKRLALPLGWCIEVRPHELRFLTPDLRQETVLQDYEYDLPVPGELMVCEAGAVFETRRISTGTDAGYNPGHLLDAGSLPGPLKLRNWRAGDRFWPNHTKSPKKIKELLQDRHVGKHERKLWPVVVSGNEIVWMRGFPPPARHAARPGHEAILIVERPLEFGG